MCILRVKMVWLGMAWQGKTATGEDIEMVGVLRWGDGMPEWAD